MRIAKNAHALDFDGSMIAEREESSLEALTLVVGPGTRFYPEASWWLIKIHVGAATLTRRSVLWKKKVERMGIGTCSRNLIVVINGIVDAISALVYHQKAAIRWPTNNRNGKIADVNGKGIFAIDWPSEVVFNKARWI
jgi:hypothetical protein